MNIMIQGGEWGEGEELSVVQTRYLKLKMIIYCYRYTVGVRRLLLNYIYEHILYA